MESSGGLNRIRLLSWNLLAPVFCRPKGSVPGDFAFFDWSSEESLKWERRRALIESRLRSEDADVIALQEVQFDTEEDVEHQIFKVRVPEFLGGMGYDAVVPGHTAADWKHQADRNERVLDVPAVTGVAILFRPTVFALENQATTSRCLLAVLRHLASNQLYSVACVHLEGHPDLGDLRRKQLMSIVKKARSKGGEAAHLILVGDFNSVGNEVEEFNQAEHNLLHVRTGPTWSSGTTCQSIDHILVDHSVQVHETLEYFNDYDRLHGMPNEHCGSDHAPVGIVFDAAPKKKPDIVEARVLDPRKKKEIDEEWAKIEKPPPARGKPTPEQLIVLRDFAAAKKAFIGRFNSDDLESTYAKKVAK